MMLLSIVLAVGLAACAAIGPQPFAVPARLMRRPERRA